MEGLEIEAVNKFRYLGVIANDGNRDLEIKERIMTDYRAFQVNKKY